MNSAPLYAAIADIEEAIGADVAELTADELNNLAATLDNATSRLAYHRAWVMRWYEQRKALEDQAG